MPTVNCEFWQNPELLAVHGPTLMVEVGFDLHYRRGTNIRPNVPADRLPALVDTGAWDSAIDSTLADELNLPIIQEQEIAGVGGLSIVKVHLAQIFIPDFNVTIFGRLSGIHLAAGGQIHRAIIGRTFLRNYFMTYDGHRGIVTLSNDYYSKQ